MYSFFYLKNREENIETKQRFQFTKVYAHMFTTSCSCDVCNIKTKKTTQI